MESNGAIEMAMMRRRSRPFFCPRSGLSFSFLLSLSSSLLSSSLRLALSRCLLSALSRSREPCLAPIEISNEIHTSMFLSTLASRSNPKKLLWAFVDARDHAKANPIYNNLEHIEALLVWSELTRSDNQMNDQQVIHKQQTTTSFTNNPSSVQKQ